MFMINIRTIFAGLIFDTTMMPGKVTSLRTSIVTHSSPRPRCTTPPRPVVDESHETPLHKQISLGITSSKTMPLAQRVLSIYMVWSKSNFDNFD
jgi:hypothetical protein